MARDNEHLLQQILDRLGQLELARDEQTFPVRAHSKSSDPRISLSEDLQRIANSIEKLADVMKMACKPNTADETSSEDKNEDDKVDEEALEPSSGLALDRTESIKPKCSTPDKHVSPTLSVLDVDLSKVPTLHLDFRLHEFKDWRRELCLALSAHPSALEHLRMSQRGFNSTVGTINVSGTPYDAELDRDLALVLERTVSIVVVPFLFEPINHRGQQKGSLYMAAILQEGRQKGYDVAF
ncbi:hypothetical protein V8E36_005215 [Tilletia maclaganii]